MRTNINLDEVLISQAMALSGLTSKKETVEQALREFVERLNRKDISELFGKIEFAQGYDYKALRGRTVT
jgi:Arc/MetJ family transcription regulator